MCVCVLFYIINKDFSFSMSSILHLQNGPLRLFNVILITVNAAKKRANKKIAFPSLIIEFILKFKLQVRRYLSNRWRVARHLKGGEWDVI